MRSRIICLLFSCLSVQIATAQHASAPQMARDAFTKKYPGATKTKWTKEKGLYEATFEYNGHHISETYTKTGQVMETETAIAVSELPKAARDYAAGQGRIKEAAKIIKADGTELYEAEVKHKDLLFDKDGKYISPKVGKK